MNTSNGENKDGPSVIILETLFSIKRRIVPLSLWIVFCIMSAGWYLHTTPSLYTATATIILEAKRTANTTNEPSSNSAPALLDSAQAESQIQVIKSERLLSSIFSSLTRQSLDEFYSSGESFLSSLLGFIKNSSPQDMKDDKYSRSAAFNNFSNRVIARRVGQSYVIEVSFTSNNPETSRKLTNSIISGYLLQQVSFKLAAAQNGAEYLQGKVNNLGNQVKIASEGMQAGEVPSSLLPDADARVIGSALEPLFRSSPKTSLVIGFAFFSSIVIGLFSIAIMNGFDRKIRFAYQIERDIGIPCLGMIPVVKQKKLIGRKNSGSMLEYSSIEPESRFSAAVRNARTSLFATLESDSFRAIGFASLSPGVGKTIIATNIASTIASSGSSLTLVDANMYDKFGSYTSAFNAEGVGIADVIHSTEQFRMPSIYNITERFNFISSSSARNKNRANIYLGSRTISRIIGNVKLKGDVLVDLPSLDISAESRSIGSILDGVVIVAEWNKTTIDDIRRVIGSFNYSKIAILGVIVNKVNS